jgi:hypothetical protein
LEKERKGGITFVSWLIWCMEPGFGERKEGRNNICILVDLVHGTRVKKEKGREE